MPIEIKELIVRATVDEPTERVPGEGGDLAILDSGDGTDHLDTQASDTIDFIELADGGPDDTATDGSIPTETLTMNFIEIEYSHREDDDLRNAELLVADDPYQTFNFTVEF